MGPMYIETLYTRNSLALNNPQRLMYYKKKKNCYQKNMYAKVKRDGLMGVKQNDLVYL